LGRDHCGPFHAGFIRPVARHFVQFGFLSHCNTENF
jgi:hypothetical protein